MKVLVLLSLLSGVLALHECPVNQHYTSCGTACPLTCENYQDPPKFCNFMCAIGCQCDDGFVKNEQGACVRPEQCPSHADVEKTCVGEAETGFCRANFRMWYYDAKTQSCQQFTYGGCGGNGNKYATEEECIKNCGNTWVWNSDSDDVCELPSKTGICMARFIRYFFNSESGKCEQFVYGGCGGNGNNFRTEEDCAVRCGGRVVAALPGACQYAKEVGPCKAAFLRYYFDKDSGKCEQFIYGGCGGNSNNFETAEDCHAVCAA